MFGGRPTLTHANSLTTVDLMRWSSNARVGLSRSAPRRLVHEAAGLLALLAALAGCSTRSSTFQIIDYREGAQATCYHETMDEAYYDFDAQGNVDIVLRRSEPAQADPAKDITQVIHIRTVWRSIPGDTVAERTQINGTISYHIVHGHVGATFEGAGSVFFWLDRKKETLSGSLDQALLRPKRRLHAGGDIFKRAELMGEFRATRDHRRVVRIVNDMERLFGPRPALAATATP